MYLNALGQAIGVLLPILFGGLFLSILALHASFWFVRRDIASIEAHIREILSAYKPLTLIRPPLVNK
jgi:hypothetical protein